MTRLGELAKTAVGGNAHHELIPTAALEGIDFIRIDSGVAVFPGFAAKIRDHYAPRPIIWIVENETEALWLARELGLLASSPGGQGPKEIIEFRNEPALSGTSGGDYAFTLHRCSKMRAFFSVLGPALDSWNRQDWMREFVGAGGMEAIDGLSVHFYLNGDQLKNIRGSLADQIGAAKTVAQCIPLICSEFTIQRRPWIEAGRDWSEVPRLVGLLEALDTFVAARVPVCLFDLPMIEDYGLVNWLDGTGSAEATTTLRMLEQAIREMRR